jgi:glycosyltransferase involved in cell wall biosynthesis
VQNQLFDYGLQWAGNGCVIHNGVNIKQFSPVDNGATSTDEYLLFVGSLSPHKGLQTVIDALALLNNDPDIPPVMVRVAGGGHEVHLRLIKSQINRLGLDNQIQLLGRLERRRMPELYCQARALVFPSIWQEPLARTTQEAMACGVPVIATLTGGTAELVENRINGLTFEPGDARGLAAQIKYLWANPELARQMGKAARQTIEDRFNIESTSIQIENYLIELGKPRR